ncbi:MAG: DUF58 domain-containing protein [Chloroflexota bacterium]|nr:DUF58 domain-containing protein [Chloroflexota bacterium]
MRLLPLPRPGRQAVAPTTSPPGTTGLESERLFDEELLARLRRLVLLSRRSIAEGLAGEHRSRRRGSSPEFADFKSYSQGDDFRRIDWNTYARFEGLFVRLSEVTTEFDIHILLDSSESMNWTANPRLPTKFTYALRTAGALGYVSLWHFDRLAIAPFGSTLAPRFGPAQGRANAVPMLRYLEGLAPSGATDLASVLDTYLRARRRPGLLVLISDLLSGEPEQIGGQLRKQRAEGWQTIVVHVVDPAELDPATLEGGRRIGATELVDVELGDRLRLTPTAPVVERYRTAIQDWLAQVEDVCEREEAEYFRLQTDWPFETIVLRLLHERGVVA